MGIARYPRSSIHTKGDIKHITHPVGLVKELKGLHLVGCRFTRALGGMAGLARGTTARIRLENLSPLSINYDPLYRWVQSLRSKDAKDQ
jgi:hypothetical protein